MAAAHRHEEHAGYATPAFARDAAAWSAHLRDARAVRADSGASLGDRGYSPAAGGGRPGEVFEEFGRMAEVGAGYGGGGWSGWGGEAEPSWPVGGDPAWSEAEASWPASGDLTWSEAESGWPAAAFDSRGQSGPAWSGAGTGDPAWSEAEASWSAAGFDARGQAYSTWSEAESAWPAVGFDSRGQSGPTWSEAESAWPAAGFDARGLSGPAWSGAGTGDPAWSGSAVGAPGLIDTGNLTATGDLTWSEPETPFPATDFSADRPFVPPTPRRTTSHRRPAPRRHLNLRTTAIMALGAGLVVTTPLVLRNHHGNDLALTSPGPGTSSSSTSEGVPAPSSSISTSPTVGAASTGNRPSATPTSRRSTRPPTSASSARASQSSQSQQAVPTVQLTPDQAVAFEEQVVALTNAQRAANGCVALRADPRLTAAAIAHSVDMRARDYFGHDTPDGVTPWTRIQAQGYSDPSAENIAMGQRTPQAVVDAWMNSPGHRANILNCASKAIGVGVQFGSNGPWWTQDFGYS